MSGADVAEPPSLTWQEWLDLEDGSEDRHELIGGRLVLDQGATDRHDTVVTSLYNRLAAPFQEQRCRVYPHNRKVVTPSGDGYYPDLLIRCGPRSDERYESAPTWIVEVVSPTDSLPQMQAKLGHTSGRRAWPDTWLSSRRRASFRPTCGTTESGECST